MYLYIYSHAYADTYIYVYVHIQSKIYAHMYRCTHIWICKYIVYTCVQLVWCRKGTPIQAARVEKGKVQKDI